MNAWNFAFEQLIKKEPVSIEKKTGTKKVTMSTAQLVRKIEKSSLALHEISRIRVALAGYAHNQALSRDKIEDLSYMAGIDRIKFLKALGLNIYPW